MAKSKLKIQVTMLPEDRWDRGMDHDGRSEEIYRFISGYDWEHNGGSMDLKAGGDGDNGEELMYLLDEYFAAVDSQRS